MLKIIDKNKKVKFVLGDEDTEPQAIEDEKKKEDKKEEEKAE